MLSKGIGLFPTESVSVMRDYTLLAEDLGYDNVWFGDSQNIWREASITMGAAATGTKRVILGAGVTNAVTRHRSLLASTWATLAEYTGGRVALGIGTGDSSLRTMGLKPLKLAELEHVVSELRALLKGHTVREATSDAEYRLSYLQGPANIPIYIAASAPRILEMAGRIADGVIVLVGTAKEFIEGALEAIETGAAASGRQLSDLHIVLWTPTAIQDDSKAARDLVRAHVARVCIRPLPAQIDPSLNSAVERIRANYDYYHHMETGAGHADLVPDELVELFALAGTEAECTARIAGISKLQVDQMSAVPFVPPGESREHTIRRFASAVDSAASADGLP